VALNRFGQHVPDILDSLAQLSNDEVPTPPTLANEMLDLLPAEVWTDPSLTWLDPCSKSGVFLREVAARLLNGLAEWEPDFDKRREHIFKKMLYGTSITEITGMMSRRSLYYSRDASSEHSVVRFAEPDGNLPFVYASHTFKKERCTICGAPEDLERGSSRENYAYSFIHGTYPTKGLKDMKFDVIVGNPPYQIDSDGNSRTMPIYQQFVEHAVSLNPRYLTMITPSRWFSGGLGLDDYRARMLSDHRMRTLVDYPNLFECFPGVEIKGGVSYFLWDRSHNGDCEIVTVRNGQRSEPMLRSLSEFDVLVRANDAIPILRKVQAQTDRALDSRVATRVPFGLQANFKRYQSSPFDGSVKIYGNKFTGYVDPSEITKNIEWVGQYKALLPKASDGHGRVPAIVTGKPILAKPGEACTDTYLVVGVCATAEELTNFGGYLRTKFARFLISLRKVTQDNKPSTFAFVPDLPMNRSWTDHDLYAHFGLTKDEIDYVESQIRDLTNDDAATDE
jgi:site-specific DNA-methyltransferase (adenine-specific)